MIQFNSINSTNIKNHQSNTIFVFYIFQFSYIWIRILKLFLHNLIIFIFYLLHYFSIYHNINKNYSYTSNNSHKEQKKEQIHLFYLEHNYMQK